MLNMHKYRKKPRADKTEVAVTLADNMTKGIQDAMLRINQLALDKCDTLADSLAVRGWGEWDQSNESPNVINGENDDNRQAT